MTYNPVIFGGIEILIASRVLRENPDSLARLETKVFSTSDRIFSQLLVTAKNKPNELILLSTGKFMYNVRSNTILVHESALEYKDKKAAIIIAQYVISKFGPDTFISKADQIIRRIKKVSDVECNIRSYNEQIDGIQHSIAEQLRQITPLVFHSFDDMSEVVSKYKGTLKKVKDPTPNRKFLLKFHDLMVGNDLEGFIGYDFIGFYLDDDYRPTSTVFGINNVCFDTGLSTIQSGDGYFHPHLTLQSGICHGNRKHEVGQHLQDGDFDMVVDDLYSVATQYDADGHPFASISECREHINHTLMFTNGFSTEMTPEDKAIQMMIERQHALKYLTSIPGVMAYTHSNCSRCQEPLVQAGDAIDFGFVCQNPECPASTANVVDKKCSVCKTRLIIVGWSPRDQYFHGCPNPECGNYSPSGFGEYFDADSDQVLYNMILDTNPNYIANREKQREKLIAEICNARRDWRTVLDATDDYTIFHIENLFTTDNLAEVAEKYIKSFLTSITAMIDRRGVCIKQPTAYSELLFPSGSPFKVEFYKDAMRKMLRWKYADDPDLDLVDWLDQIGCLFSDWMEEWINELLKIEGPEVEESISVADL